MSAHRRKHAISSISKLLLFLAIFSIAFMAISLYSASMLRGRTTSVLAWTVAMCFFASAFLKAKDFDQTLGVLDKSQLIPEGWVQPSGYLLLATEAITAASLLIPLPRQWGLRSGAILSATFASYAVWRALKGIDAPCACFGRLFVMSPLQSGLLALGLLVLCLTALVTAKGTPLLPLGDAKMAPPLRP